MAGERFHRGLLWRWAALATVALAGLAWAHDADVIYVLLTEPAPGPEARMEEVVTLTAGTLSQLAPVDADGDGALSQADLDARADAIVAGVWNQMPLEAGVPCARGAERAILRDGYVELVAQYTCPPGPLSQEFRILNVLTSNYRVVLGRQLEGERDRDFAQGNKQRLLISPHPPRGLEPPAATFGGGAASVVASPGVTLLWLWALLMAGSLAAAGRRTAAVVLPGAIAALAASQLAAPALPMAGIVVGVIVAFGALMKGAERWAAFGLVVLSAAHGLAFAAPIQSSLQFQLGRAGALVGLAVVAIPVLRIIARRPVLKRRLGVALVCAALAGFGFFGFSLLYPAAGG